MLLEDEAHGDDFQDELEEEDGDEDLACYLLEPRPLTSVRIYSVLVVMGREKNTIREDRGKDK